MLLALLACPRTTVPPHLQVDPVEPVEQVVPSTPDQALAQLIGRDPLLRRPRLPEWLDSWPEESGLPAFARAARDTPDAIGAFSSLEQSWPGTPVVVLARGWRLGAVEGDMSALLSADPLAERRALDWLSPLVEGGPPPMSAQSGWSWLPEPRVEGILRYGEGWVMRGWLDGPGISLGPVQAALHDPTFDRLSTSPEGQVILNRGEPAGEPPDLEDLERLVGLFLEEAAADQDKEQERFREKREALAAEQGVEPREVLLHVARSTRAELTAEAGWDEAAGGAVLAWTIERWWAGEGLDRGSTLARLGSWSPRIELLSEVALLALLKHAVDHFVVAQEHGRIRGAAPGLADALAGCGAQPLEVSWLERGSPGPGTWLALTRATGRPDGTDAASGLAALQSFLAERAALLAERELPEAWRSLVLRIQKRAS